MRPRHNGRRPNGQESGQRPETNIRELRRRMAALQDENRQLALAAAQTGRSTTAAERAAMQAKLDEIRGIKETLRAFGCLYE